MDLPEDICLVLCWMKEETGILVSPVCRPFFVAPLHWLEFTVVKFEKIQDKSTTGWLVSIHFEKNMFLMQQIASLNPMECGEILLICLMIGDPFPWTSDPILQHLRVRTVWVILMCFLCFLEEGWMVFPKVCWDGGYFGIENHECHTELYIHVHFLSGIYGEMLMVKYILYTIHTYIHECIMIEYI